MSLSKKIFRQLYKVVCGIVLMIFCIGSSAKAEEYQLHGATNEEKAFHFFVEEAGFSPSAAIGVITNISFESSFNPNALGDKGTSYGICQWHDTSEGSGRWTNLKNFSVQYGADSWQDLLVQLRFLIYELNGGDSNTNRKRLYNLLCTDVGNSPAFAYLTAYEFCRVFEVPADTVNTAQGRARYSVSEFYIRYISDEPTTVVDFGYTKSRANGSTIYKPSYLDYGFERSPLYGEIIKIATNTAQDKKKYNTNGFGTQYTSDDMNAILQNGESHKLTYYTNYLKDSKSVRMDNSIFYQKVNGGTVDFIYRQLNNNYAYVEAYSEQSIGSLEIYYGATPFAMTKVTPVTVTTYKRRAFLQITTGEYAYCFVRAKDASGVYRYSDLFRIGAKEDEESMIQVSSENESGDAITTYDATTIRWERGKNARLSILRIYNEEKEVYFAVPEAGVSELEYRFTKPGEYRITISPYYSFGGDTPNLYEVLEKTITVTERPAVRYLGAQMTLSGAYGLQYFFDFIPDATPEEISVVFECDGTRYPAVFTEQDGYELEMIPAKYDCVITPIVTVKGVEYTAEAFSMKDYLISLAENENSELAKAMLAYGEACKQYFAATNSEEDETGLQNTGTTLSIPDTYREPIIEGKADHTSYLGCSLVLEGRTTLKVYLTDETKENSIACYSISDICPGDLEEWHTIEAEGLTIRITPMHYLYKAASSEDEKLKDVVKTLYRLYELTGVVSK